MYCSFPERNLGLLSWRTIHQSPAFLLAPKPLCLRVQGLTHSQAQLCQRYFDHMPVISIGAKLGIYECQRQFRFRHWNCSSDNEASAFGPVTLTENLKQNHPFSSLTGQYD
ncbi:unnamed protein product [Schistosoma curassoni]|uniref:Protein Wnt n=1 Tax=Schistosoma curassoni TaxID=6186 RepID=A0A183JYN9_9TREM|nr:unnamed protein product [Schistosoma curassoni]